MTPIEVLIEFFNAVKPSMRSLARARGIDPQDVVMPEFNAEFTGRLEDILREHSIAPGGEDDSTYQEGIKLQVLLLMECLYRTFKEEKDALSRPDESGTDMNSSQAGEKRLSKIAAFNEKWSYLATPNAAETLFTGACQLAVKGTIAIAFTTKNFNKIGISQNSTPEEKQLLDLIDFRDPTQLDTGTTESGLKNLACLPTPLEITPEEAAILRYSAGAEYYNTVTGAGAGAAAAPAHTLTYMRRATASSAPPPEVENYDDATTERDPNAEQKINGLISEFVDKYLTKFIDVIGMELKLSSKERTAFQNRLQTAFKSLIPNPIQRYNALLDVTFGLNTMIEPEFYKLHYQNISDIKKLLTEYFRQYVFLSPPVLTNGVTGCRE